MEDALPKALLRGRLRHVSGICGFSCGFSCWGLLGNTYKLFLQQYYSMMRKLANVPAKQNASERQLPKVRWGRMILIAGGSCALVAGTFLLGYSSSESKKARYTSPPQVPCICEQAEAPAEQREKLREDVRKLRALHRTVERARLEIEILSRDIKRQLDSLEFMEVEADLQKGESPADSD